MSQYIGKTIALVSNKEIRYVGVLDSIDSTQGTVALKQVRLLGTETREADPAKYVPPGDMVYEYVVFRGTDVKDLSVLDTEIENVVAVEPAFRTAAAAPVAVAAAAAAAPVAAAAPAPVAAAAAPASAQPQAFAADVSAATPDFDFESANARFVREEAPTAPASYNKKLLFFDLLSQPESARSSRPWRQHSESDSNGQWGRGRGGRRGGRGGGRGGRGGKAEEKPEWA